MRKILLFLVFTLAIGGGMAGAQDFPPTFCGDLAETDCAILTDSAAAMRELESAAFNFDFNFAIEDIPDAPFDTLSVRLTGDGAYAIRPGLMDTLAMSPTAMADMMQNMQQLPQMLDDILTGIAGDVNLLIYLPQNLPVTRNSPRLPERVGLSMRLVDGVGYVNLDKLAELDRSGDMPRGWIGIDLAEAFKQAFAEQSDMLDEMQQGMTESMGMMNMDMMSMFTDPAFADSYMSITRAADTTINGQDAAVFETAIDLGALYSSEALQEMMTQQFEAMSEAMDSSGVSDEDMAQIMNLYSTLFDGLVINTTQTIGLDDQYVHAMSMTMDWAFDVGEMAAAFGETGSARIPPIQLSIDFQGELSQFNNAPTITAPEGANIMPLNRLFGGRPT